MEKPVKKRLILVLENNLDRVSIIETAFQSSLIPHELLILGDLDCARDFLYRRGEFAKADRPDLILLDLHLPEPNNWELLREIKEDKQLRRIPIIVLTVSEDREDILRSYQLKGNCYIIKSTDRDNLIATIARIETFWLEIVTLPIQ
jgi:chemotaxis family two-component system response regulator Rcp1